MNLEDLLFDIKYFHNDGFIPSDDDRKYMDENSIEKSIKDFEEKQSFQIIEDCHIEYDSDGDEYSHYSWPYKIHIMSDLYCDITFEDDGILIEKEGFYINFPNLKTLTIADFLNGLKLAKCNFKLLKN